MRALSLVFPKVLSAAVLSYLLTSISIMPAVHAAPDNSGKGTTLNFELRDPKTKEVYFTGEEKLSQDGKNVLKETSYFDSAKKEVQKDSFAFEASSLRAISWTSSNSLTGEEAAVVSKDTNLAVSYRPNHEGKTGSSVIKAGKELFLPTAAGDLILQNWDSLVAGKPLKFDLVIPSRLETIPFQIVKRETRTVDNESREVFSLMPQNILIRMLAPHLEFQYSQDKKIRQAVFPSSMPINGAKDKMVEMIVKS